MENKPPRRREYHGQVSAAWIRDQRRRELAKGVEQAPWKWKDWLKRRQAQVQGNKY